MKDARTRAIALLTGITVFVIASILIIFARVADIEKKLDTATATASLVENNNNTNNNNTVHSLSSSSSTIDSSTSSSSSKNDVSITDYSWLENTFIPPPGIPTFTPEQMLEYFQKRNVLFVGDSLIRRFHGTLFAILNAEDKRDYKTWSLNGAKVIDIGRNNEVQCHLHDRLLSRNRYKTYHCEDLQSISSSASASASNDQQKQKKGRFDYLRINCFQGLSWFFNDEFENAKNLSSTNEFDDYDLMILGNAAWELDDACPSSTDNYTMWEKLDQAFETVRNVTSPKLQIAYRTSGFVQFTPSQGGENRTNIDNQKIYEINRRIREFVKEAKADGANMTLVDFGKIVESRSFGEQRIPGDTPQHYGLEPRLALIHHLMHVLTME